MNRRYTNAISFLENNVPIGKTAMDAPLVLNSAVTSNGRVYRIRRVEAGNGINVMTNGINDSIVVSMQQADILANSGTSVIRPEDMTISGPWNADDPLVTLSEVNRDFGSGAILPPGVVMTMPVILYRGKNFSAIETQKQGYFACLLRNAIGNLPFRLYLR